MFKRVTVRPEHSLGINTVTGTILYGDGVTYEVRFMKNGTARVSILRIN